MKKIVRLRPRSSALVAALVVFALVAWQGIALAGGTAGVKIDTASDSAGGTVRTATGASSASVTTAVEEPEVVTSTVEAVAPVQSSGQADQDGEDDDSGTGPSASASGQVINLTIGDTEILVGSQSNSQAGDDGATADATVLSILGQEIIGAHSDSKDGEGTSQTGLLMETCGATGGQICLALLFGQATTMDDDEKTAGSSDTAAVYACLGGGEESAPTEVCEGPVSVSVLDSHSDTQSDKDSGKADASESSNGAQVCLGGENEDGVCDGVGVVVLHSESEAHAGPGGDKAEGEAYVLGIEQGGEESVKVLQDEQQISLPTDCATSIICVALNTGDSNANSGGAGNKQQTIGIEVLPEQVGGKIGITDVGTSVEGGADEPKVKPKVIERPKAEPKVDQPAARPPTAQPKAAQLPFTGRDALTVTLAGIALIAAGLALATNRRVRLA